MALAYAEVIGDPIAHSRSPEIHNRWLGALGMAGEYVATHVPRERLEEHLALRRPDPAWRGCNVTIPHKQAVIPLLDEIDEGARAIGAVNCVVRDGGKLVGSNTDVDGIAAALAATAIEDSKVAVIGAGGGARAALYYLGQRRARQVILLVRDPEKAGSLRSDGGGPPILVRRLDDCAGAIEGVRAVVNASPLGMKGAAPMPPPLLGLLAAHAAGATFFDMVYSPLETEFLAVARAGGATTVDGLTMLVGQARCAFERLFGRPPPRDDQLRDLLAT